MRIERHCGVQHVLKSECTKHTAFGALLEVEMWKKCTRLRHEAHVKVKMVKRHMFRPLLDVEASFMWQAQWILHLAESEQNVSSCKKWEGWDI